MQIRPFHESDIPATRALLTTGDLDHEFHMYSEPGGLEGVFTRPVFPRGGAFLALSASGELMGAGFLMSPPQSDFYYLRLGVHPDHRRKGIATVLMQRLREHVRTTIPSRANEMLSAWMPAEAATAFAARHGFKHLRYFWQLTRTPAPAPGVEWPEGVEYRTLDGSDRMIEDWSEGYNRSFARHFQFSPTTVGECLAFLGSPGMSPGSVMVAYRGGKVAGFCANRLSAQWGEVATIGTAPEARGIGLGRALLRWGVGYLLGRNPPRVTLMVDGENEGALKLYRSEGFEIWKTREVWEGPGG